MGNKFGKFFAILNVADLKALHLVWSMDGRCRRQALCSLMPQLAPTSPKLTPHAFCTRLSCVAWHGGLYVLSCQVVGVGDASRVAEASRQLARSGRDGDAEQRRQQSKDTPRPTLIAHRHLTRSVLPALLLATSPLEPIFPE